MSIAPVWGGVAKLDFSDSNQMTAIANASMKNLQDSLTKTGADYQDAVRRRNYGLLQDYINQAKSPDELQGEQFQQGYKNLLNTLNNEYDPTVVGKYLDDRGDVLTKRANDALSLQRDEFGFEQEQLKANTNAAMNNILGLSGDAQTAAIQQAQANGLYDPNVYQEYLQTLATTKGQQDKNWLFDQTRDTQVKTAKQNLINAETEHEATLASIEATKASTENITQKNRVGGIDVTAYENANLGLSKGSPNYINNYKTLQVLLPKVEQYAPTIQAAAEKYGLDPNLIKAIMAKEGTFDGRASPSGARGIMQIMPDNQAKLAKLGIDTNTPEGSIMGAAYLIKENMQSVGNNLDKVLAAYNTGANNVLKHWGTDGMGEGGGVMSDSWNRAKDTNYNPNAKGGYAGASGETKRYVNTAMDYYYALSGAGNGTAINNLTGGGSSGTSGAGKPVSQAEKDRQYAASPEKVLETLSKDIASLSSNLKPDANKGKSSFKSLLEFQKEEGSGWLGRTNMGKAIVGVINGQGWKWDNAKNGETYKSQQAKLMPLISKLSDEQKAFVAEYASNKVKSGNTWGLDDWSTNSDQRILDYQQYALDATESLFQGSIAERNLKEAAAKKTARDALILRHNKTGEEADALIRALQGNSVASVPQPQPQPQAQPQAQPQPVATPSPANPQRVSTPPEFIRAPQPVMSTNKPMSVGDMYRLLSQAQPQPQAQAQNAENKKN